MYDDTIAAIATPPGEGGLGVVRLSGPDSQAIAATIFRPVRSGPLRAYRLRYGHVIAADGQVIDEALLAFMRGPRSFTAEDVIELSVHGGPLPVQRTLAAALTAGARLARPGEFTLRAFLNGRLDLSRAEATLDVIQSRTEAGLAVAQAQLGGWLAREVRAARAHLMEVLAYVTVAVDFPEDEVEAQSVAPPIASALAMVERLLASAAAGMVYRQGARAALIGRPNAGKSSLLNALLRSERAIVTPIPGTTRDTLEETANLAGVPVVLVDTAGITESADPVERLGVERSREALRNADLALLVVDARRPLDAEDRALADLTLEKPTLLIWNKLDLPGDPPPAAAPFAHPKIVATATISAQTGLGIGELAQQIAELLLGGAVDLGASEARLVSNPRHRDALRRAHEFLQAAAQTADAEVPTDLLAGDLTAALNALGEITGETVGDDLLDLIFSRFCIGK